MSTDNPVLTSNASWRDSLLNIRKTGLADILGVDNLEATQDGQWTCEEVLITPAIAQKLLDLGGKNRVCNQGRSRRYAHVIKQGRWTLNGETIVISESGKLLDGQHRANAIIRADKPVKSFVISGLPDSVFHTLDQGSARTAADILSARGVQHCTIIAAALRYVIHYFEHEMLSATGEIVRANLDIEEAFDKYREIERYAHKSIAHRAIGNSTCYLWARYLTSLVDERDSENFIEKVVTGVGLDSGSPMLALRERMLDFYGRNDVKPPPMWAKCYLIVRAWNAWRGGQSLKVLRVPNSISSATFPDFK